MSCMSLVQRARLYHSFSPQGLQLSGDKKEANRVFKDVLKFCGILGIAGLWEGISILWSKFCIGIKQHAVC